jgi:hypothetical protein
MPFSIPSPEADTPADRIARWLDLMRASDKLLLAGLRRKVGPNGDLVAAYQQWYVDHMREHDEVVRRVARRVPSGAQCTTDETAHRPSERPPDGPKTS